jgi:phospholipase/carboxylesterase
LTKSIYTLLHGYGSNEEDLFSFASELPRKLLWYFGKAPYDTIRQVMRGMLNHYDADENKFSDKEQAKSSEI